MKTLPYRCHEDFFCHFLVSWFLVELILRVDCTARLHGRGRMFTLKVATLRSRAGISTSQTAANTKMARQSETSYATWQEYDGET